jgi:hypothetical protein
MLLSQVRIFIGSAEQRCGCTHNTCVFLLQPPHQTSLMCTGTPMSTQWLCALRAWPPVHPLAMAIHADACHQQVSPRNLLARVTLQRGTAGLSHPGAPALWRAVLPAATPMWPRCMSGQHVDSVQNPDLILAANSASNSRPCTQICTYPTGLVAACGTRTHSCGVQTKLKMCWASRSSGKSKGPAACKWQACDASECQPAPLLQQCTGAGHVVACTC